MRKGSVDGCVSVGSREETRKGVVWMQERRGVWV